MHPSHSTATATSGWDDLARRLERFLDGWESGTEPPLDECLPEGPPPHRRLVLVELIKVDLEQRATRDKLRALEDYVREFPELLEQGEPPCDLIYEEFHILRSIGKEVALTEYCQRFPKAAEALKRLVGTQNTFSTQICSPPRKIEGLAPGQRLDDFDLQIELGRGSFGSVYLARQVSIQRMVALKVSADKGSETETLSRFDHPNIVRVFDQKRIPEKKLLLIYMMFAPGGTLSDVVRRVYETPVHSRNGSILVKAVGAALAKTGIFPLDDSSSWARRTAAAEWPDTVCRLGMQLALALDHAHRQGVLHRDVKPANVLLTHSGAPQLADFNISFNSQRQGATAAAYFGGSLAYMSPEQLEACNPNHPRKPEELDGRSDLYALGVVLWELLHGARPFPDVDMTAGWVPTLEKMVAARRETPPWRAEPPTGPVDTRLEKVLFNLLSPDREKRHLDGATLARELALATSPRAWDLVHDLQSGWCKWAVEWPIVALVLVNLTPYAAAGAFNWWYNWIGFIKPHAELHTAFDRTALAVNGTLYPIGIVAVLWLVRSLLFALWRISRGEEVSDDERRAARRTSMLAGHFVAGVGLVLWLLAGFAFPVVLDAYHPREFPASGWIHFPVSMFISGLISFCFPFLATTWLSIRVFFPTLLGNANLYSREQKQLSRLSWWAGWYQLLAIVVPLIAFALMLVVPRDPRVDESTIRTIMVSLIAACGLGAVGAYFICSRIRGDLTALTIATRPADMIGTPTDSVEVY
ncbi:MAG: serine/threonine protein kinase [Pirellulaceae bacterium]|jgi:serine/threonine protein kinase|nr:serine/threonine protein kinase [Pirellulaceae bacterium]